MDPCEAAVNEPFIYQGWGKNQTFIVAIDQENREIHDVTASYTTNHSAIFERRELEGYSNDSFRQLLASSKTRLLSSLRGNDEKE
jgi:hypothetical protein